MTIIAAVPKLSILISTFSGRDQQFDFSLQSLTRHKYDHKEVELLVFLDFPNNTSTQLILKKYKNYFSSITTFSVISKKNRINHSVTRRNFLATQAKGEYIIFSEPEMFHVNNTIQNLLSYISNNKNKREWLCGPVYAGGDLADKSGKVIDDCIQPTNLEKLISILQLPNLLNNQKFKKNYFLIDYSYYKTPFFLAMFNRKTFLSLKGLNQNLKVRGFEEIEFHKRFSQAGGKIVIFNKVTTIHIPHIRNIDKESQISWNLYNSTVLFDSKQKVGDISDAKFEKITI